MKVITAMEWRKILDALEYVKEHIEDEQCVDCFSYDIEETVDEAIAILSALEDKDAEDILKESIEARRIETLTEQEAEAKSAYEQYEKE